MVIGTQCTAHGQCLVDAQQVTPYTAEYGGGEGNQNAPLHQTLEQAVGTVGRQFCRLAESEQQGAAHADGSPNDTDAEKHPCPHVHQVFPLGNPFRGLPCRQGTAQAFQGMEIEQQAQGEGDQGQAQVALQPFHCRGQVGQPCQAYRQPAGVLHAVPQHQHAGHSGQQAGTHTASKSAHHPSPYSDEAQAWQVASSTSSASCTKRAAR